MQILGHCSRSLLKGVRDLKGRKRAQRISYLQVLGDGKQGFVVVGLAVACEVVEVSHHRFELEEPVQVARAVPFVL